MVRVDIALDVYEAIKQQAEPLEDDVSSVLRRVMELNGSIEGTRAEAGTLLHVREYEPEMVRALGDLSAFDRESSPERKDLIDRVGELLSDRLSDEDYTRNTSGRIRWRHRAGWALTRLKRERKVDGDGAGRWWLTEDGKKAYEPMG